MRKFNFILSSFWRTLPTPLKASARLIAAYLISNESVGPTGIQVYSIDRMKSALGMKPDAIEQGIAQLTNYELVIIESGYIWTPLRWLNEGAQKGKIISLVNQEVSIMPPKIRKAFQSLLDTPCHTVSDTVSYGVSDTVSDTVFSKTRQESESESESESDIICPAKSAGRKSSKKSDEDKKPARLFYEWWVAQYQKTFNRKPKLSGEQVIYLQKEYNTEREQFSDEVIKKVAVFFFGKRDEVWKGHAPHLLFKHWDTWYDDCKNADRLKDVEPQVKKTFNQFPQEDPNEDYSLPDDVKEKLRNILPSATKESAQ